LRRRAKCLVAGSGYAGIRHTFSPLCRASNMLSFLSYAIQCVAYGAQQEARACTLSVLLPARRVALIRRAYAAPHAAGMPCHGTAACSCRVRHMRTYFSVCVMPRKCYRWPRWSARSSGIGVAGGYAVYVAARLLFMLAHIQGHKKAWKCLLLPMPSLMAAGSRVQPAEGQVQTASQLACCCRRHSHTPQPAARMPPVTGVIP